MESGPSAVSIGKKCSSVGLVVPMMYLQVDWEDERLECSIVETAFSCVTLNPPELVPTSMICDFPREDAAVVCMMIKFNHRRIALTVFPSSVWAGPSAAALVASKVIINRPCLGRKRCTNVPSIFTVLRTSRAIPFSVVISVRSPIVSLDSLP